MAKVQSLDIDAGATFDLSFKITNDDDSIFDLTGYSARLQIRKTADAATAIINVVGVIHVATGIVNTPITAAQTSLLTDPDYVYSVELSASGGEPVYRLVQGNVFVSPEVVR